jgi:hypothetical protein
MWVARLEGSYRLLGCCLLEFASLVVVVGFSEAWKLGSGSGVWELDLDLGLGIRKGTGNISWAGSAGWEPKRHMQAIWEERSFDRRSSQRKGWEESGGGGAFWARFGFIGLLARLVSFLRDYVFPFHVHISPILAMSSM